MGIGSAVKRKSYATRGRRVLLEALARCGRPLSARGLHEFAGSDRCDLATVHRSLRHFVRTGEVTEVFSAVAARLYEINDRTRHHHHVSCLACEKVEDVPLCRIGPLTRYAEKVKGYEIRSHSFELFGICPSCQGA